jgi:N-acetylglucosaminyl-diphospho-decaprenol L-rhamnosyltransferase
MDMLIDVLVADNGPCRPMSESELPISSSAIRRRLEFRLLRADGTRGSRVHVAEMADNLGYPGAINAWLRPLLQIPGWEGAWILNPDTEPTPSALAELLVHSVHRKKLEAA